MKKLIAKYEIIDHGVNHSQYFSGCGISYTAFNDIATGIGDNPNEALQDALESLAQNDWDVSTITEELSKISEIAKVEDDEDGELSEDNDCYHYVSVRVTDCLN